MHDDRIRDLKHLLSRTLVDAPAVRRYDANWAILVIALDDRVIEQVTLKLREKGVLPTQDLETLDTSRTSQARPASNLVLGLNFGVWSELGGTLLNQLQDKGYRRCVVHCWNTLDILEPAGVDVTRLFELAGVCQMANTAQPPLIDLMARVGYSASRRTAAPKASPTRAESSQATQIYYSSSNAAGTSVSDLTLVRAHSAQTGPQQLTLRLLQVVNNLPLHERLSHWNLALGRFMGEGELREKENVIFVYRSLLPDYALSIQVSKAEDAKRESFTELYGKKRRVGVQWTPKMLVTYEVEPNALSPHEPSFENEAMTLRQTLHEEDLFRVGAKAVSCGQDLQNALSNPHVNKEDWEFIWYHGGHHDTHHGMLSTPSRSFWEHMKPDRFQVAFLGSCDGMAFAVELGKHVDYVIYWEGKVLSSVCEQAALQFFTEFKRLWLDNSCTPLYHCVIPAFDSVKQSLFIYENDGVRRSVSIDEERGMETGGAILKLIVNGRDPSDYQGRGNYLEPLRRLRMTFPGITLEFSTSPHAALSLNPSSKERALIPNKAQTYCFMHGMATRRDTCANVFIPVSSEDRASLAERIFVDDEKERRILKRILDVGAFVYFDADENVVAMNAVAFTGFGLMDDHDLSDLQRGVLKTGNYERILDDRIRARIMMFGRSCAIPSSFRHPLRGEKDPSQVHICHAWIRPEKVELVRGMGFPSGAFVIMKQNITKSVVTVHLLAVGKSA